MIYSVIPAGMSAKDERRLREHYGGNANVDVIHERRSGTDDRRHRHAETADERRVTRDRRRARVAGTFPRTVAL